MSDERIKPCPFCGGKAVISCDTEATIDTEGRMWAYTVVCNRCCATSGLTYSVDKAIEAWNTRKPMERIVEKLEEKYNDIPTQHETSYEEGLGDGIDYAISLLKGGGVDEG